MYNNPMIPIYIHKIAASQWLDQMNMSKDDYLIVCGDFGLLFNYRETGKSLPSCPEDNCWDKEELWWLNWLEERPFTTLFVCFLQVQIPEICRQKWRILHLRFGESCRLPGRIA